MASNPVGPRPLPFNIPAEGLEAAKARDPQFWQALKVWREAEDEYNGFADKRRDEAEGTALLDRATGLLDALLATPVRTALALSVKLEVVREAYSNDFGAMIREGFDVSDAIRWDCERLAKLETFGPDAFQDMAEG